MGKPITDWEVDERGSTPSVMHSAAAEYTPVEYPRSNEQRGQVSESNKGAASRSDGIQADRAFNPDGTSNSPRRDAMVNYNAGPYPKFIDDGAGGMDEGDGASR